MRRLCGLLALVLCGLGLLVLPAPTAPLAAADLPQARIFRLERTGTPPSWLFGTMHVSDPAVVRLPPEAKAAFAASDRVVGELDLGDGGLFAAFTGMLLPEDQSLADLLPSGLYERVLAGLEAFGIPAAMANRFRPWAAAILLGYDEAELERARLGLPALDEWLQEEARRQGKAVIGLETVDEQLAIFRDLPLEWQIELLEAALDHPELMGFGDGTLKELYLAGDHVGLWRFYQDMSEDFDSAFFSHFEAVAIRARNHRMAERLAPILAEGGAFVAVGALHLPGPEGLFVLLQEAGYRIVPLP